MASSKRITALVSDLLDFARAQLGDQLPIARAPMSMRDACRLAIDEISVLHSNGSSTKTTFRVGCYGTDENVFIKVHNRGTIPQSVRARIFEPLARANKKRRAIWG